MPSIILDGALVLVALLVGWMTAALLAVEPGWALKMSLLAASLRSYRCQDPDPGYRNPADSIVRFLGARACSLFSTEPRQQGPASKRLD